MKSININVIELVQNLKGQRPMTKPVGYAADAHGTVYTLFVATDKDTGHVRTSKDGKRVKLNIRKSLNQPAKDQAAQSIGDVLGQAQAAVNAGVAAAEAGITLSPDLRQAEAEAQAAPDFDLGNLLS